MTNAEIIGLIKENGVENEVLDYLVKDRLKYLKRLEVDNLTLNATVRHIKGINNGQNDAISALCEPETERERNRKYQLLGLYY